MISNPAGSPSLKKQFLRLAFFDEELLQKTKKKKTIANFKSQLTFNKSHIFNLYFILFISRSKLIQ